MKKTIILIFILIFFLGCEKDNKDLNSIKLDSSKNVIKISKHIATKDQNSSNINLNKATSHIISYSKGLTNIEPSLKDYKEANITGIYPSNIKKMNEVIRILGKGKRVSDLNYQVNHDYIYDFNNSNIKKFKLLINNHKIKFTKSVIGNKTAFLKIRVHSKGIGKILFTHIYIQSNNKKFNYTFESNANGIRYLNVSDLNISKDKSIKIYGKNLTIDKNLEMIYFKNDDLSNKKILILSPHPDDAELAAFGIYNKYHNNTYIVTITSGDAGPKHIYDKFYKNVSNVKIYRDKGNLRVLDSLNTPRFAKVPANNILNLGFFDGTLNKLYDNNTTLISSLYSNVKSVNFYRKLNISPLSKKLVGDSRWINLVQNLAILLKEIKPDIIITPYPLIDRHPDHKLTTVALLEALKKLNIQKGKLFLYTNHYIATGLYPFGGIGDPVNLPPEYGSHIYFNGIYSNSLSNHDMGKKAIALNMMSDLRFPFADTFFKSSSICTDDNSLICSSILRSYVRKNELFFIVDIKNIYNDKVMKRLW